MYNLVLVVISGKEGNPRRKQEKDASQSQIRTLITKKRNFNPKLIWSD
jgi:hypothetical protein